MRTAAPVAPGKPHQGAGRRGFTLVELLVALVVMSLLSLMSWRGLEAMGRSQRLTQARADEVQALQSGLAQWGADLDAMATDLSNPRAANSLPSALDWNGLLLRITRGCSSGAESGLCVVGWTLGEDQGRKVWLRWQSPPVQTQAALQLAWQQAALWSQSPTAASRARQVPITPLLDWQLYYNRGGAWSNPGSSSEAATTTPDGVRLVLNLPPDQALAGTLTRDWIRPTAVGEKS